MRTKITLKMMFLIVTACTIFSCKQASDNNDSMSVDSTTTTTETDTMNNTMPDTISTVGSGTSTDTMQNGTGTQRDNGSTNNGTTNNGMTNNQNPTNNR